ncbi:hypothetical protein ACHAPA_011338 [Fusarium lateritium]
MYRPIAPTPPSAPPSAPNQQPASASTSTSAQDPELDRRNTIALAKRKQRALSRRERSLAFLDDKWKCSDWLPADVRAGLASQPGGILRVAVDRDLEHKSRNLASDAPPLHPHLTVSTVEAVRKQLQNPRSSNTNTNNNNNSSDIPFRSASVELFPDPGDFEDSYDPPCSPASSLDIFHDAPSIASPRPSLPPSPSTPRIATSDLDMDITPKQHHATTEKAAAMNHPLANLTWSQAQDAHIKAAATIAQLRGQQAAFKISETTSKQYIQDLRDDLDHYYEEEDEGRRPVKRRRSLIIDRVKQDHYNHLAETEEHCLKALPEDTDLSAEIAAASRIDTDAATVLADAKAHLSSIEQMWEAKMVWDEALKAKIKYVTIQQKMKELEDEMATACDDWHNKRDAADEWVKVAEDQGWNVLLDETEM